MLDLKGEKKKIEGEMKRKISNSIMFFFSKNRKIEKSNRERHPSKK